MRRVRDGTRVETQHLRGVPHPRPARRTLLAGCRGAGHRRLGTHPVVLLGGGGLDRRIFRAVGGRNPRRGRLGRAPGSFRHLHRRMALRAVDAGHTGTQLPHRAGRRAQGHRAGVQPADAAPVRAARRPGGQLAASPRRRRRPQVPFPSRFLDNRRVGGARRAGTGVLLAVTGHRHHDDLRQLFQPADTPAQDSRHHCRTRHTGGADCRGDHLPGSVHIRRGALGGSQTGI